MTRAVIIHETKNDIEEIELDIDPTKNEIFKILGGPQTFIGQWPDIDVVILKSEVAKTLNLNTLAPPFHEEEILGKVLLIRMDINSDPRDFTIEEYVNFNSIGNIRDKSLST